MNILLWTIQILLALHTLVGAMWKYGHTEQDIPDLSVIPHGVWIAMAFIEILCAIGLIIPFFKRSMSRVAIWSATVIALEMLAFCVLHIASGSLDHGHMIYWLIVAAVCALVIYGRTKLRPL